MEKGTRKRKVENQSYDVKTTAKKSKFEMPADLDAVLFSYRTLNKTSKDVKIKSEIKKEMIKNNEGITTGSIKPENQEYSSSFWYPEMDENSDKFAGKSRIKPEPIVNNMTSKNESSKPEIIDLTLSDSEEEAESLLVDSEGKNRSEQSRQRRAKTEELLRIIANS